MKKYAQKVQNMSELPSYQHLILGGVSGAMGKLHLYVSFIYKLTYFF